MPSQGDWQFYLHPLSLASCTVLCVEYRCGNALGATPIPHWNGAAHWSSRAEARVDPGHDFLGLGPYDLVAAVGYRNRPFSVVAESQAGNAKEASLFLDASAVG